MGGFWGSKSMPCSQCDLSASWWCLMVCVPWLLATSALPSWTSGVISCLNPFFYELFWLWCLITAIESILNGCQTGSQNMRGPFHKIIKPVQGVAFHETVKCRKMILFWWAVFIGSACFSDKCLDAQRPSSSFCISFSTPLIFMAQKLKNKNDLKILLQE